MKKNYYSDRFRRNFINLSAIALAFLINVNEVNANYLPEIVFSKELPTVLIQKKVTIKATEISVKQILQEIQKQTDLNFFYKDSDIENIKSKNINVSNRSVEQVLEEVLKGTDVSYVIMADGISIVKSAPSKVQQPQPQTQTQKRIAIKGIVLSENDGKPVVGATVIILGTSEGAITDGKGNFSMLAYTNSELEVSFVGFLPQIIKGPFEANKMITISLKQDVLDGGEVVVTGIFNKSKESYTGAVTSISSKELKMYKGQNMLATLKNIDPGLNVRASNQFGSDPNRIPEVTIRGNSSLPMSVKELNEDTKRQLNAPLVVMDGFEVSLQKLIDLNDEEVEAINILKDAAATSIYGSRGANGVIVVITKSPVAGKLKVFAQAGISIEMPDLTSYNLLNAREKLELERSVGFYDDLKSPTKDRALKIKYNETLAEILRGVDTDWISQPVRTGISQRYNFKLEGGNEELRWSALVGYNKTEGAMKGSSRDNFNGTINLAYSLKNVIFKNQTQINITKGVNSEYGNFSNYTTMNPYWRIHDEKGNIIKSYLYVGDGVKVYNPIYNALLDVKNQSRNTQIVNNFAIEWNIIDALKVRGQFGISKTFNTSDDFKPFSHTSFDNVAIGNAFERGSYSYGNGEQYSYDASLNLSYSKIFNEKHQIYAGFDYSMAETNEFMFFLNTEGFASETINFPTSALRYSTKSPSGNESATRRVGFTGNFSYTYNNRYTADFSYRSDGSSQFGSINKFAPFWSAGLGWSVHNEEFMKNSKVVNNFRVIGSIGDTGSQQFNAYQALSTMKYYTDTNYIIWSAAELMGLGNDRLKWQTTRQINGGVELGFLNNRISTNFNVYQKNTSNLLSQMNMPLANGFESFTDNVGQVENFGFETTLSGYIIRNTSKQIIWSMTGRLAYNTDKITKLSDAIKLQNEEYLLTNNDSDRLVYEGYSQSSIYAVRSLGIDPSTGREIFLDKNGNITKTWSSADRVYLGIEQPKYRGNFSTMFAYKNFSLNMSFGFHWGGKQYNETLIKKVEVPKSSVKWNLDKRVLTERWLMPGDVKFFKGIDSNDTHKTSRFVMDDNVFEMQSASLQYIWNSKSLKEKAKIQSINFSVDMSDIFYISSVKRERGTDYPFARRVGLTVSLLF